VCSIAAVLVFVGMALSETYSGRIMSVKDGKITFQKQKFNKEDKKMENVGDPVTFSVSDDVKVSKKSFDKETKKVNTDALEGGLKNKVFADIPDKGIGATITTDKDDKKITEIVIGGGKKGGGK
jgi:hypothetical protein